MLACAARAPEGRDVHRLLGSLMALPEGWNASGEGILTSYSCTGFRQDLPLGAKGWAEVLA